MPLTPEQITRHYIDDGSSVQRINHRKSRVKLAIVEPNPAWPQRYHELKDRITTALGSTLLAIHHQGSTSIPNLPAKDIIDIDLVVRNIHAENTYVPQLESCGFLFLFREPAWHEHRFFVIEADGNPETHTQAVNLHVFGEDCPEVEKHRIFREWLCKTPGDVEEYARVKRECAEMSEGRGESMQEYTNRKEECVLGILGRAYRDLGWVE